MYAAALSIALGLSLLVQSVAVLGVFCIYLVLILFLMPMEEARLRQAYAQVYVDYQEKTKRLIPLVY